MVSLTTVVLLVCACVAIEAETILKLDCKKIRKGSTKGHKEYIKPIILDKKQEYWEKELPVCSLGTTGGVDVQACDDSQIPDLNFVGNSSVALHRTGKPNSYIVVVINLYCFYLPQPSSAEQSSEDSPLYNL